MKFFTLLARSIAVFLAAGAMLGVSMFWSSVNLAKLGTPLALLVLAFAPTKPRGFTFILIAVAVLLALSEFVTAGVSFLRMNDDANTRLLNLIMFSNLCLLGALLAFTAVRNR